MAAFASQASSFVYAMSLTSDALPYKPARSDAWGRLEQASRAHPPPVIFLCQGPLTRSNMRRIKGCSGSRDAKQRLLSTLSVEDSWRIEP